MEYSNNHRSKSQTGKSDARRQAEGMESFARSFANTRLASFTPSSHIADSKTSYDVVSTNAFKSRTNASAMASEFKRATQF